MPRTKLFFRFTTTQTRINNFGERKTVWLIHKPIKVWMNSIGKLEYKNEFNLFNKA